MDVPHMREVFTSHMDIAFAGNGDGVPVVQQEIYVGANTVIDQGNLLLGVSQFLKGGILVSQTWYTAR